MSEYCLTSLSAQSWQNRVRRQLESGNMSYSYFEWPKGLFIVHSTIGSTTLHAFEQFGAVYMHSHDDKYPARPGFEPGTTRLQAPFDTSEPSRPAT